MASVSPAARPSKPDKGAVDQAALLAPRTTEFEFLGPLGAFLISTTVPLFTYIFYAVCNPEVGCPFPPPASAWRGLWPTIQDSFLDRTAWELYVGWYAFTVLCWWILPGRWEAGLPLRTGNRLMYKTNALATGIATALATGAWIALQGPQGFTVWYDHWPGLVGASLANSVLQAVYVYVASFAPGRLLAQGGNSGNVVYDWFIGRELNPRLGSFDIKTFNELRPGLLLWCVLDVSCLCAQYTQFGSVTDSMILVVLFHVFYVADSLFNEATIFSQMDITTDGFGFMLSVGDLTWVPFTYSLQARYLAFTPLQLGRVTSLGILALNAWGYYIFRTANLEKNEFRNGNNPKSTFSPSPLFFFLPLVFPVDFVLGTWMA